MRGQVSSTGLSGSPTVPARAAWTWTIVGDVFVCASVRRARARGSPVGRVAREAYYASSRRISVSSWGIVTMASWPVSSSRYRQPDAIFVRSANWSNGPIAGLPQ